MKKFVTGLCFLFVVYSGALLRVEYRYGQDYVRNYFTDITGPVQFYAANTTLSAFMLWSLALIFGACWALAEADSKRQRRWFYASQVLLFLYLGIDERFMLHEWFGELLDCNDAYFILLPGMLELAALFFLGDVLRQAARGKLYLVLAAGCFAVMNFFDVIVPDRMLWRLSIEDLSKLWSDLFLVLFAVEVFQQQVQQLKQRARTEPESRL